MNFYKRTAKLEKRGFNILGRGAYSAFYAKGGERRGIKVNRMRDDWPSYALWGAKHGYAGNLSPRVFSLRVDEAGGYTAVVERLAMTVCYAKYNDPNVPEAALKVAHDLEKAMRRWSGGMYTYATPEEYEAYAPNAAEFVRDYEAAFPGFCDAHANNIMFRDDWTLCVVDPICDGGCSTTSTRMRNRDLEALRVAA